MSKAVEIEKRLRELSNEFNVDFVGLMRDNAGPSVFTAYVAVGVENSALLTKEENEAIALTMLQDVQLAASELSKFAFEMCVSKFPVKKRPSAKSAGPKLITSTH